MEFKKNVRRFCLRFGMASVLLGLVTFGPVKTAVGQPGTPLGGAPGFQLEFDELGHGRYLTPTSGGYIDDPGVPQPGGGLLFFLPVPVSPGDVLVVNPAEAGPNNPSGFSDLLSFEGHSLLYRSLQDESELHPDPADVLGLTAPGTAFSTLESGPEGMNGFVWLVDPSGPSYTVYNGISDTPELSTFVLGGLGLIALFVIRRWRRAAA
jgi:hypothetical protein